MTRFDKKSRVLYGHVRNCLDMSYMIQNAGMVKSKSYQNNLKKIRQEEGINRSPLAREADVSDRHLSRIESEEMAPQVETANRIKNAINKLKTSSHEDYTLADIFPHRKW